MFQHDLTSIYCSKRADCKSLQHLNMIQLTYQETKKCLHGITCTSEVWGAPDAPPCIVGANPRQTSPRKTLDNICRHSKEWCQGGQQCRACRLHDELWSLGLKAWSSAEAAPVSLVSYQYLRARMHPKMAGKWNDMRTQQPITVPNEQTIFLLVSKQRHEFPEIKQNWVIFM